MTKKKAATKVKASKMTTSPIPFRIVLGFDAEAKPCGAKVFGNPVLVAKAARELDMESYEATSKALSAISKKLPTSEFNEKAPFKVPQITQDLYSEIVAALVADPSQGIEKIDPKRRTEIAPKGYPAHWNDIAPGHLVIAHEGHEYGWWEAIVFRRDGELFTLRYREFPKLPKFVRAKSTLALMHPPRK